jgi:enamine deaminase RidA (YjgF/YER057c/UK114 family)
MRLDLSGMAILLISGTAGIDEHGQPVHTGDFRAQFRHTLGNLSAIDESFGSIEESFGSIEMEARSAA